MVKLLGVLQDLLTRGPIPNLWRGHRCHSHGRAPDALSNPVSYLQIARKRHHLRAPLSRRAKREQCRLGAGKLWRDSTKKYWIRQKLHCRAIAETFQNAANVSYRMAWVGSWYVCFQCTNQGVCHRTTYAGQRSAKVQGAHSWLPGRDQGNNKHFWSILIKSK